MNYRSIREEKIWRKNNLKSFFSEQFEKWLYHDLGIEIEKKTDYHYWFLKNGKKIEVWPTSKKWREVKKNYFKNKTMVYEDLEELLKREFNQK